MDVTLDGRYRTGKRLGRGSSSCVYRATDMVLGRDVAVKVFTPLTPADNDRYRRRGNESVMLTMLEHPGLVSLLGAGSYTNKTGATCDYLVLELITGEDLCARLSDGAVLSSAEVLRIGGPLANTLAYVHGQGVVHRDVKPANILLPDSYGDHTALGPRLIDFGIAQPVNTSKEATSKDARGTASYLSPEQAMGKPACPASDIYSLGLVLLECLTGQRAFPGSALVAATAKLLRDPVVPPGLETPWLQLLARMTAREAADRPTAKQVAVMLGNELATNTMDTTKPQRVLCPADSH